ncbi:hypothetical protein GCM10022221_66330 [Actinocorallia aurea]
MTPGEIGAAVVLTTDGVDLTGLGDAALLRDLGPSLVLRGAVRTELPNGDGVQVSGTALDGPFKGLFMTASFTSLGVTATGVLPEERRTEDWSLSDGFPAVRHCLLGALRFREPALERSAEGGFTFTGDLVITTETAPLDLLVPGVGHRVSGWIVILDEIPGVTPVPQVTLLGPEGAALDLGLLTVSNVRYEIFGDPEFDLFGRDMTVAGQVVLTGTVAFTSYRSTFEIPITTRIRSWSDPVLLTADLRAAGRSGFADVTAFLRRESLDVPGGFEIEAPVVPARLTLLLDPAGAEPLRMASLTLETDDTWDAGVLELQAVDVTFQITRPLSDAPEVDVVFGGLVAIGEHGVLDIGASFDDGISLGGTLRAGAEPLSLHEVYQAFTDRDDVGHLPPLDVSEFRVRLDVPPDGGVHGDGYLELTGAWEVLEGVTLDQVGFSLAVDGETAVFTTDAVLTALAMSLRLHASYDDDAGWRFEGASLPGQRAKVGEIIGTLPERFTGLTPPAPIRGVEVHDLAASFATGDGRLTFTAGMLLPLGTAEVDLTVDIDTGGDDAPPSYGGRITLSEPALVFAVHFTEEREKTLYAASSLRDPSDPSPSVRALVGALVPSAAPYVPAGIVIDVLDAVLASDGTGHLVMVDLTATLDLAGLPVVGPALTGDSIVGFDPLRLIAAGAGFAGADLAALNPLLPDGVKPLPEGDLPAGFTLDGVLRLGPLSKPMTLPVAGPAAPARTPERPATDVAWLDVRRSFGPVHVERVGMAYRHDPGDDARLRVLLDAAVSLGGLTLSCSGLSAGISLADPGASHDFDLDGLGLSYAQGPFALSGAFRKGTVSYRGLDVTAYTGAASLSTETFSVGALGSYVQLDEGPSLFVHAFLDHPIGGPAFFFVRGLAAGFGYNRAFTAPPIDEIADFPLVAEAIGARIPDNPTAELQRLEPYLPPSPGDFFLAFGVHFTSFEMVDSFLLAVAGLGHKCELDVLGVSTLVLPAPEAGRQVTPVAEIRLALRAVFAPDDGYFLLQAQLAPDSYLFSRACRLTGGFAFATWFGAEHHGDFVLSVGGYHPHFTPPAHYPVVPRPSFTWQVSEQLSLKGSAYYALTPAALMAGAALSATWEDGSLRAWFDASIDFLIAWQPYHYEASFHLSVGASYTFSLFGTHTLTMYVSTDVDLWGPEFGGTATIDLGVVSFAISFGSASGASPDPVPWSGFRAAQLPEAGKIVTISARGGALVPGSGTDLGAFDPTGLVLGTDAAIPSTAGRAGPAEPRSVPPPGSDIISGPGGFPTPEIVDLPVTGTALGVAPVGLAPGGFASVHHISISRRGSSVEHLFRFEPVGKSLPAALWGSRLTPAVDAPALVENALTGYTIRPADPEPGPSVAVPATELTAPAALFTERDAFAWIPRSPFRPAPGATADLAAGAQARAAIAARLLPGAALDLAGFTADDLLAAPEVAHA